MSYHSCVWKLQLLLTSLRVKVKALWGPVQSGHLLPLDHISYLLPSTSLTLLSHTGPLAVLWLLQEGSGLRAHAPAILFTWNAATPGMHMAHPSPSFNDASLDYPIKNGLIQSQPSQSTVSSLFFFIELINGLHITYLHKLLIFFCMLSLQCKLHWIIKAEIFICFVWWCT